MQVFVNRPKTHTDQLRPYTDLLIIATDAKSGFYGLGFVIKKLTVS